LEDAEEMYTAREHSSRLRAIAARLEECKTQQRKQTAFAALHRDVYRALL
jgi:division protein CdvB (Snf7/Vps24/ESCRT-III family)